MSLLTAMRKGTGYAAALTKSVLHGIVRGTINVIQHGGKFMASFASGFISSAFSVAKNTFASLGEAAIVARTTVMALVGGVTSELTGGKFANGAVSAAFVHLFNAEAGYPKKFLKVTRGRALTHAEYDEQYRKNPAFRAMLERGRMLHENGKPFARAMVAAGSTGVVVVVGGEVVVVARAWVLSHPNEVTSFVQGYGAANNYNPIGKNVFYHFGRAAREITDWLFR